MPSVNKGQRNDLLTNSPDQEVPTKSFRYETRVVPRLGEIFIGDGVTMGGRNKKEMYSVKGI